MMYKARRKTLCISTKFERNRGTMTTCARCLIEQGRLDKTYWPYAKTCQLKLNFFVNGSGIKRAPFEAMNVQKSFSESLKIELLIFTLRNHFEVKIDQTSQTGITLGPSADKKTYLIEVKD